VLARDLGRAIIGGPHIAFGMSTARDRRCRADRADLEERQLIRLETARGERLAPTAGTWLVGLCWLRPMGW